MNEEQKLGEGSYAQVYKIKEKKSQIIFAAKLLKMKAQCMFSQDKLSLERELEIIQKCNHPFIIKFIEEFLFKE